MTTSLDLRFHVGVLGFADFNEEPEALRSIRRLFGEIRNCLAEYNTPAYGLSGGDITLDLYADTRLSGGIWTKAAAEDAATLNVINTRSDSEKNEMTTSADSVTSLDGICGYFDETGAALEWIVAQSDMIILLRDGDGRPDHYAVRSGLSSRITETLCISIDAKNPAVMERLDRYSCEPFSLDALKTHIAALYPQTPLKSKQTKEAPFFLSGLWHVCYSRFIQKYKAEVVYEDNSFINAPARQTYLDEQFKTYDEEANAIANEYREAIYFRSILPFVSTVFLAVGFYTETLLGIVYRFENQAANIWMIVAGIGFMANALIGVYTYLMSRSKSTNHSQSEFLRARYIAEFLRVVKQYSPAGVPVSLRFVRDKRLMADARVILRSQTPQSHSIDQEKAKAVVQNSITLIEGQIAYHERTKTRLKKVVKRLSAFRESVFWTGFALVMLRGALQIAMPFISPVIDGSRNGIAWVSFIRSFSNMLALMIPAWAVYFSSKLSLNNFSGLFDHSGRAVNVLRPLGHKAESLASNQQISYQALMALSEDILSAQMEEVDDWYAQTAARAVQRL